MMDDSFNLSVRRALFLEMAIRASKEPDESKEAFWRFLASKYDERIARAQVIETYVLKRYKGKKFNIEESNGSQQADPDSAKG